MKMMCLRASYKKKYENKYFFCILKINEERSWIWSWIRIRSGVGSGFDPELDPDSDPDPDPVVKGTFPGIRIRTKSSRIPNTAFLFTYSPLRCTPCRYSYGGGVLAKSPMRQDLSTTVDGSEKTPPVLR